MTAVCRAKNVTKSYGGREVVSDLSLNVTLGEMVSIVGPSGSGKSTLLNMLGLLDSADSGEIFLFGDVAPRTRSKAATVLLRYRLAYLFQNFALIDNETVAYNLKLAQRYSSDSRPERSKLIRNSLASLGLGGSENKKVFQLSGGEQQRVAIARLFVKPCELILADEPTGSLDPESRDRVLDSLRGLCDQGKTVVIVTHDPAVVEASDRAVSLMRDSG